jgi:zinc protease
MKRRAWMAGLGAASAAFTLGDAARAATPGVDAPPEPGPQRALPVPASQTLRLPNGLALLLVQREGVGLVTASLYLRAGREADPAAQSGLASITAGLLSKGAQRNGVARTATQLAREAEALGSGLDVNTSSRVASLSMTITTPKLAAALALMADVVRQPSFDAAELERLRNQSLGGLRVAMANPGDVAAMVARRAHWGASVHGASLTTTSLARIQREAVQRFHRERYQPDQTVLVLAGELGPLEGIRALVQQQLGGWTGQATPLPEPAAARAIEATTVLVEMPGSGQSGVVVTAPFAAIDAPERRIAEVAAALIGGGYSARLNQEIRIQRGLSYGAFGGGESLRGGGMFSAQAQTDHPNAAQVAQIMREQLLLAGRELAAVDELAARQATLIGSFARQLGTTAGVAGQVASQWFQGKKLEALGQYVDDIMAVTPAQVRDYAARTWTANAIRTVAAIDPVAGAAALPAFGDAPRRVRLSELDLDSATLTGTVR